MRLAVLDTNVIVSAGIRRESAPAMLVLDWVLEGQIQLVTSPTIVAEYHEVASRPKFRRYGFPPSWLDYLIGESLQLPDAPTMGEIGPDRKDLPFLALARQTGAWLITGNVRHFPAQVRKGVTVLSPADYLLRISEGRRPA